MDKLHNKQNILLVKDDVGRAKPCTVKLPPQGFVYGKPENKLGPKGSIISGEYEEDEKKRGPLRTTRAPVDFRKLNKAQAFSRGNSEVNKENQKFRVGSRRPVGYISGLMKQNVIGAQKPSTAAAGVPKDATFGKANRPSTPIQGVISFTYANMAEQELSEKYNYVSKMAQHSRHQKPVPGNTRARELAMQHVQTAKEK